MRDDVLNDDVGSSEWRIERGGRGWRGREVK